MNRLQKIRAYMAKMNPVKDPAEALDLGLYVQPPEKSTAQKIAETLEIEPDSTHVIVGGIGSGKTTELLVAVRLLREKLHETRDKIIYLDVSQKHSLNSPRAGVLVALVGKELSSLARQLPEEQSTGLEAANKAIHQFADGFTEWVPDYDYDHDEGNDHYEEPERPINHPGVLDPVKPVPYTLQNLLPHLLALKEATLGEGAHMIFAFDSLDRLTSPEDFTRMLQDDLRLLKQAGVGVAVAAPIRLSFGDERAILEMFDYQHYQLAYDPALPEGKDFLHQVLRSRSDASYLPNEVIAELAKASGGALRNLISLAKAAGKNAYEFGHDPITTEDATNAINELGHQLNLGLTGKQIVSLLNIRSLKLQDPTVLSLIETNRVLVYKGNRLAVHPTLLPLLDSSSPRKSA